MDKKEIILNKLNSIFHEKFNDNSIVLKNETTADDIYGWDSLKHVMLIIDIENTFNIKFNPKELLAMENVGQMIDVIDELTT